MTIEERLAFERSMGRNERLMLSLIAAMVGLAPMGGAFSLPELEMAIQRVIRERDEARAAIREAELRAECAEILEREAEEQVLHTQAAFDGLRRERDAAIRERGEMGASLA